MGQGAIPGHAFAQHAVERVSLSNGDIAGLESNLESQLTASSDAAASVPILHELGLLQLRRGGDPELAVALFLEALERTPGHALVAQDLLRACEIVSDGTHAVLALEHLPEEMSPSGRALAMARAAAFPMAPSSIATSSRVSCMAPPPDKEPRACSDPIETLDREDFVL